MCCHNHVLREMIDPEVLLFRFYSSNIPCLTQDLWLFSLTKEPVGPIETLQNPCRTPPFCPLVSPPVDDGSMPEKRREKPPPLLLNPPVALLLPIPSHAPT